ncbi:MAG: UDP-glucose 4-epimerase GalE [Flavobacteriaceae bacterium]|nr:UDP-glucose 4-epimerase GalE [Flavobacteriaceae bacterium]
MKRILVTGGLGYIGSHTVVALQEEGFEVVIIDNLSNSDAAVLDGIESITGVRPQYENLDLRNKQDVGAFFDRNSIDGIIHFAASKAVGESVEDPLLYYENNLHSLIYLLQECKKHGVYNFIFSSSCTVYGEPDSLPITEAAPVKEAVSPYGNTKQISEEILRDTCHSDENLQVISLRYFNPIGAHGSASIGELPKGKPQNLVPFITQTAAGIREELSVFGDDYPTPDGSCVRDYIHVVDLAEAHVVSLKRLISGLNEVNFEIFNLGTGRGSSVLEVVRAFETVSGEKLKYKIVDRRPGDVIAVYADTQKANDVLGWKTQKTMEEALDSAWSWEKKVRGVQE